MIWPKHRWIGWGTFGVGVLIVVVSVARFLFPDLAAGYERLRDTLFLIPLGTAIGIVATLAAVATWRRITTPAALVHPALRMKGWAKMVQIAIEYDPSNPVYILRNATLPDGPAEFEFRVGITNRSPFQVILASVSVAQIDPIPVGFESHVGQLLPLALAYQGTRGPNPEPHPQESALYKVFHLRSDTARDRLTILHNVPEIPMDILYDGMRRLEVTIKAVAAVPGSFEPLVETERTLTLEPLAAEPYLRIYFRP